MEVNITNVGAPDSELRNSPILDDEEESLDPELEAGVCYFNGRSYALGDYVRSGEEILRCAGRGVWIRQGEIEP